MRKVEDHPIRGKLNELADKHYVSLQISPLKTPQEAFSEAKSGLTASVIDFLNHCLEELEFKRLIIASPEELDSIVVDYERNYKTLLTSPESKNDRESILKIFRYEAFRDSIPARSFVENLKIRACPYCNAQHILTTRKGLRCHFDHIRPKARHPYLSLSFFNLVPCCSHCNIEKAESERLVDPYLESFSGMFEFKTNSAEAIDFLLYGDKRRSQSFKVSLIPNQDKENHEAMVAEHNKRFGLHDIYNQFEDIVEEIYRKSEYYNDSRREELGKICNTWFGDGPQKANIDRIIVGNYTAPEDINQRPLSKFMTEIAREAKLIK